MPYPTTALDPAAVRLSHLRAALLDGPGPAGFDAASRALAAAAEAARATADDLDTVLRREAVVHAGAAADGARTHLASIHRDAVADAGRLDRAARAAGTLAGLHAAARRDVVAGPEDVAPGAPMSALFGAVLDGGDGERRARLAVAAYQDGCNDVLSRVLPVFGAG